MGIARYFVRKGSTDYNLVQFSFEKEGNQSIDEVPFSVTKANSDNFSIGDDVSIGYYDGLTFVKKFAGDIVSKEENETVDLLLESYGGRLNRASHFSEIYEDVSPEFIMEDVLTKHVPSLNYASTATSGITISEFVIKEETPDEVANRLLDLLQWQLRTDVDKNFYFEPAGTIDNNNTIIVGTNAWMETKWSFVPNSIINDLTFIGGNAVFNKDETYTATASQTVFPLSNKIIGTVKVKVNGVEQTGGLVGSTGSFDYTYKLDNFDIIFTTGLTAGQTVLVSYDYGVPIKIKATNDESIASNGRFSRKITESNVVTLTDARNRVKNILGTYSNLSVNGEVFVNYSSDYDVGQNVTVVDSFNNVNRNLIINSLRLEYPGGLKTIRVGTPLIDQFSWQKNLDSRLKKLESKQDNNDTIQQYRAFSENLNASVIQRRVRGRTLTLGHVWIAGTSTNAIAGVWTGTNDGEQLVVGPDGDGGRIETTEFVLNKDDTFIEDFNSTNYQGSTITADWDTSQGRLSMSTDESLSTLKITTADSSLIYKGSSKTQVLLNSTEVIFGTDTIQYYIKTDVTDWTEVTKGTLTTLPSFTELQWKVVFVGQGGVNTYIENIEIEYRD